MTLFLFEAALQAVRVNCWRASTRLMTTASAEVSESLKEVQLWNCGLRKRALVPCLSPKSSIDLPDP